MRRRSDPRRRCDSVCPEPDGYTGRRASRRSEDASIGREATAGYSTTKTATGAAPVYVQEAIRLMLAAPFASRVVNVHKTARGQMLLGRPVGKQEPTLVAHLAKRIWTEQQWTSGTTTGQYLEDLRTAIGHKKARFVRYQAKDGRQCVGCFAPNTAPATRLGTNPHPFLWVVYDVQRDRIVTGHMASSLDAVDIPESAEWL
jgi:hypothetical protein